MALALLAATAAGAAAQTPQLGAPRLLNVDAVAAAVSREYPPELLKRQLGGVVRVRLRVSETGVADSVTLGESTGDAVLDSAALRVAAVMRFTPPVRDGKPVALWVVQPVKFEPRPLAAPRLDRPGRPEHIRLLNGSDVISAAAGRYPLDARSVGLRARVGVRLLVDAAGLVRGILVDSSSCFPYFDRQALELAGVMRFAPTPSPDAVARLTAVTLRFSPESVSVRLTGELPAVDPRPQAAGKVRTHSPQLLNESAVIEAMETNYPAADRPAAVPGKAIYRVLVDEDGSVVGREVQRSSGRCDLDVAGLRVIGVMRFNPGTVDGRPVQVWLDMPLAWRLSDPD